MGILDKKFKHDKLRYIFQCALAGVSVLVVLAILLTISNAAVIAALGASSFIVFVVPHAQVSHPRFVIGGYVVGVVTGSLCYWVSRVVPLPEQVGLIADFPHVVFGAGAVALSTFLMVITDSEHPPAASLALGFVLMDEWRWLTVAVVLAGVVVLALVKQALKPVLRNLL